MKLDSFLSKAARLAKKRDYEGALKILKAEEDRYNGSFKFYYLYGVICLYSGSHVEALIYLKRAKQIKINDPNSMLGLAVLYLKRMNTVQAVDYYLDVQEIDPKNKTAKKALEIIRRHSNPEELSEWLSQDKMSKLFPPIPSPAITAKTVIVFCAAFFAALILTYAVLVQFHVLSSPFKDKNTRQTAEFILSREERTESVETGGSYRYILTRDQALSFYDRALSLFSAYRDEAAKINLNRILESNASEGLKNRAILMKNYMEAPGFHNFNRNDNVSFSEVRGETILYRDVYVIWNGMAFNSEITDEHTYFDFLVGYDTNRTFEGIVPVIFKRPVSVNTDRTLEVLGKIVIDNSVLGFYIEGEAIHQSGRLEY